MFTLSSASFNKMDKSITVTAGNEFRDKMGYVELCIDRYKK